MYLIRFSSTLRHKNTYTEALQLGDGDARMLAMPSTTITACKADRAHLHVHVVIELHVLRLNLGHAACKSGP